MNAHIVDGRPVKPVQVLDGMLQGNFEDNGDKVWAMEKFGHAAHAGTFRKCDLLMMSKEAKEFDRDKIIREFISAHTAGTEYPIADYWHWNRRFGGGCFVGREQFLHDIKVDFADKKTPEWFIDKVYREAPPPFNDCCGIYTELRKAYGLEATE